MNEIVSLKDIVVDFDGERILDELSLDIHDKEFVTFLGPSGCGKTSLLSIFAGILQPSSGKAEVLGAPPDPRANSTGYMLQRDHLFDWRTIEQNALLGLEVKKRLNAETHAYAAELLDRYGLGAFKNYYPRQLSGGMKQKAALIRTLAFSPELLLLDEPTTYLDMAHQLEVLELLSSGRIERMSYDLIGGKYKRVDEDYDFEKDKSTYTMEEGKRELGAAVYLTVKPQE